MPLYDYRCQTCGHVEEVFAHMNDPHPDSIVLAHRTMRGRAPRASSGPNRGAHAPRCPNATLIRVYAFRVIPDVPEHYNDCIDQVVKSRRHLRELQDRSEGAFRDYEPIRQRSSDWAEPKAPPPGLRTDMEFGDEHEPDIVLEPEDA